MKFCVVFLLVYFSLFAVSFFKSCVVLLKVVVVEYDIRSVEKIINRFPSFFIEEKASFYDGGLESPGSIWQHL